MLQRFLKSFQPIFYVQISADRIVIRNVRTGEVTSEVPEIAVGAGPKRTILGVGNAARPAANGELGAQVINPFAHPRSLVSDFTSGEQLLRHMIRRAVGQQVFMMAPLIVVHPIGNPAGGFTQIELRAFREMALGAGAARVVMRTGRPLTDQEIVEGQIPDGDGTWE